MRAGFYQFAPAFGDAASNLRKVQEALRSVEADLLVLPELMTTGYQFVSTEEALALAEEVPKGPATRLLAEIAADKSVYLVAGLAERAGDRVFNSAVLVSPRGHVGTYRKAHLFSEETLWFAPGTEGFSVWDIGSARVGLMICFDWIVPEAARTLALRGADLIAHPANLVLPYCPDAMVTRCLENRVWAVTANRIGAEERGGKAPFRFIGRSEVVSPRGEILYRASTDQEELRVVEIDPAAARDKRLNPFNDLFAQRRPELYE